MLQIPNNIGISSLDPKNSQNLAINVHIWSLCLEFNHGDLGTLFESVVVVVVVVDVVVAVVVVVVVVVVPAGVVVYP